jgi:hypothetical protein
LQKIFIENTRKVSHYVTINDDVQKGEDDEKNSTDESCGCKISESDCKNKSCSKIYTLYIFISKVEVLHLNIKSILFVYLNNSVPGACQKMQNYQNYYDLVHEL